MKRAFVTGGSSDIGTAICRRLAKDGLHVIVHGSANPERVGAVAADTNQNGGSTVVAPGIIKTAMTENVFSDEDIARMVPLKREGSPDEVVHPVSFLASPEAAYITGQVISINGGMA